MTGGEDSPTSIAVLGAGAFGTAIATTIARGGRSVLLYCRTADQADAITRTGANARFLPGHRLPASITATNDLDEARRCAIVFLAFPAAAMDGHIDGLADHALADQILVNLVKGFHPACFTFAQLAAERCSHADYVALKGPTFARPMFLGETSGLTCGTASDRARAAIVALFRGTNVQLDHHSSAEPVDALSAIKNIYAIVIGIAASLGASDNTAFLLLAQVIRETKDILAALGIAPDALFTYSGLGDLLLTGLCDMSRNRTLGFMLGRGIHIDAHRSGFLTEGVRSIAILHARVAPGHTPLLQALTEVLEGSREPLAILSALRPKDA